ncbi:hypothetical protein SmJEL517_g00619 [Synchytrium microbalum]|uniref:Wings apart-like protein C-terminal domain-containing protein n=1 Tax=Synchytrium microbalum TaxID=1806994 RepID=A0A507CD60_9FUNG|nr:uncharacterized protein SmJEL517_g00619 [Synchytrium microbalum]TPX37552.1 hypothetical protein SmJEL517_g00619 [Synchytrium microbalum]
MRKRPVTYRGRGASNRRNNATSAALSSSPPRSSSPSPPVSVIVAPQPLPLSTSTKDVFDFPLQPDQNVVMGVSPTRPRSKKPVNIPSPRPTRTTATSSKRTKTTSPDSDDEEDCMIEVDCGESARSNELKSRLKIRKAVPVIPKQDSSSNSSKDSHYKKRSSPPKRRAVEAPLPPVHQLDMFDHSSAVLSPTKSSSRSISKSKPITRANDLSVSPTRRTASNRSKYSSASDDILKADEQPLVKPTRAVVGTDALGGVRNMSSRSTMLSSPANAPATTVQPSVLDSGITTTLSKASYNKSTKIDLKPPPPPRQQSRSSSRDSMEWEIAFGQRTQIQPKVKSAFDDLFEQKSCDDDDDLPPTQPLPSSLERAASNNSNTSTSPQRLSRIARMKAAQKPSIAPGSEMIPASPPKTRDAVDYTPALLKSRSTDSGDAPMPPKSPPPIPKSLAHVTSSHGTAPVTYGRTRTILANASDGMGDIYVSMQKQARDEGLEDSDEDEEKNVKSTHEMRLAGEMKRFQDEMEYLLDGLQDGQPLGIVRTSCLAVSRKLLSSGFLAQVKAHDFLSRVYGRLFRRRDGLAKTDPVVLCTVLTLIALLMADDIRNVVELSMEAGCLDLLVTGLSLQPDPFIIEMRSKFDRTFFKDVVTFLKEHDLSSKVHCCAEIATGCLAAIIATPSPRILDILHVLLAPDAAVTAVISTLTPWLKQVKGDVDKWRKRNKQTAPSLIDVHMLTRVESALRVLEFISISGSKRHVSGMINEMADGVVWLAATSRSCTQEQVLVVTECLIAMLSLIVNLTHDNTTIAQQLSQPHILSPILRCLIIPNQLLQVLALPHESSDNKFSANAGNVDVIVTAVSLVVNLIEMMDEMVEPFAEVTINLECPGHGVCFGTCKCKSSQNLVDCISVLYQRHDFQNNSANPELALVTAYYALLLGMLLKSLPATPQTILSSLNGGKEGMIAILEELAFFQELVAGIENQTEGGPSKIHRRRSSFLTSGSETPESSEFDSQVARGVARIIAWLKHE